MVADTTRASELYLDYEFNSVATAVVRQLLFIEHVCLPVDLTAGSVHVRCWCWA